MAYRRRVPRGAAGERSLLGVYDRAVALTARMDAEKQIILSIAFAHVLELPLPRFTTAVRRYRRQATLKRAEASSVKRA